MRRQLSILMLLITGMLMLSTSFIFPYQVLSGSSTAAAAPQLPPPVNLALGKAATQASTDTVNGIFTDANRAVDGNTNGNISAGSVSQTLSEVRSWWEVDLGAVGLIGTVEVHHRTDCCSDQAKFYYILVSDKPFISHDLQATINQPEVTSILVLSTFNDTTTTTLEWAGRYVRIQFNGFESKALSLAEVRVLGVPLSTAPAIVGGWDRLPDLPNIPVHISLLPSGKLLFWGRDRKIDGEGINKGDVEGISTVHLWDPVSNTFTPKNNTRTNLFCSGHSFLPNGDLFVVGGFEIPIDRNGVKRFNIEHGPRQTNIFDYRHEVWIPGPDMAHGRWYPSVVTLSNGETLIVTGDYATFDESNTLIQNKNRDTEILGLNRTLLPIQSTMPGPLTNYPFLHLGPNGNVLVVSRTDPLNGMGDDDRNGLYYDSLSKNWFDVPNLDLRQHHDLATSVMYDRGKVMVIGGKETFTQVGKGTEEINLNQQPWTLSTWATAAPMNFPRYFHTSVLMPDGQVFVVGGSKCGGGNNIRTQDELCTGGAVMYPEIYNPGTGVWSIMARQEFVRMYHSVALLMPDARILVAGGGRPGAFGETGVIRFDTLFAHKEAELFSPPYLFNANGSLATRPTITSGPPNITYGQIFSVGIGNVPADQIGQVVLVRLPSVTHGLSFDQRRVVLSRSVQSPQTLSVTAPANGNECPPGPYMLFVLGQNGVPSVAKMISVDNPVCNPAPQPPSGLAATTLPDGAVEITWTAPSGPVHHYELDRKQSISAPFIKIADIPASIPASDTKFIDRNLPGPVAYLYQLRAVCASGGSSQPSNMDLATTISFTDSPLRMGVTVIYARHIDELRLAVNAVRATAGLSQTSWTDAALPGVDVKEVHIVELRQNLNAALQALGLPIPSYTDPTLIRGLIVRTAHVEELRLAVR